MKEEHESMHKNNRWAIFTFPVLIVIAIIVRMFFDSSGLIEEISLIISILRFLIWGFVIYFILHPFVSYFERKLAKLKLNKLLAILIVYLVFAGILYCVFFLLLPTVFKSIMDITKILPEYLDDAESIFESIKVWVRSFGVVGLEQKVEQNVFNLLDQAIRGLGDFSLNVLNASYNLFNSVLDFLIGIVISIYMIIEKDSLARRIKKIVYSIMPQKPADKVCVTSHKSGIVFRKFIIGKSIDSIIVGVFSFFVFLIIKVPLPVLLAVIIGLTNMIPTIGPIIGAVPCIIITLMIDPTKVVWVLAYILFVQTVDGMILGPKILGDSLGLKPFYIIVAVFIGGGLFGVVGAFLATPTLAVIKLLLSEFTDRKLKEKRITIT
jgi:predicted PurR-regulated permease PerM